ncbi:hypothetical protein TGDOM2_263390 [Toxoplasma gondii GAB2-2007-GAL-DOM2]|uniref:Uncharacterized protein n=12 Tax=Toxoplasma gondii TaxID=5811 RepID=A0A125YYF3_TOXGV|nr:hypothetical protein TGGT1_263390 [Toxoplasma gondii GT1]ESS31773.1 hypothetical protein TGVEG_263390 [Toxoplasma gondii VEG]KAF4640953.1 hypothetical protein TGRH88_067610 [Toxoplasma gondii]KFG30935.1 hypothetical protein TGDOM2_263390 [Toxoplasma gondii GAB2-2007-GAL-DOM2]KFG34934.1 hypothetical protein TGP89_263390 [Toxoplasma gondii p89]KFG52547.1 hypothetical protein TGFOU_263390 [Toxoplasma gondii FOU]KFH10297.1 hypothetical protein TGVAND_263390 [Toxoplasma gondii VAND]PUA89913.1 
MPSRKLQDPRDLEMDPDSPPPNKSPSLPERHAKRRAREWLGGLASTEKKQKHDVVVSASSCEDAPESRPSVPRGQERGAEETNSSVPLPEPRRTPQAVPAAAEGSTEQPSLGRGVEGPSRNGRRSASKGTRIQAPRVEYSSRMALQNGQFERPVVTVDDLKELNDPEALAATLGTQSEPLVHYSPDVRVSLGEGGRELLRACLLLKHDGSSLTSLQGASVQTLLLLAHQAGLWCIVQRIVAERATGIFSRLHLAFNQFKALQMRLRKELHTESMLITRSADGSVQHVLYEPHKSLQIGKEGRSILKARLCRYIGHHQDEVAARLEAYGLGALPLKHATVPQLLAIAWVLNQWDLVIQVVRRHDDQRRLRKNLSKSPASKDADADPVTLAGPKLGSDDCLLSNRGSSQTHAELSDEVVADHGSSATGDSGASDREPLDDRPPESSSDNATEATQAQKQSTETVSVDRLLRILQAADDPSCKDAPEVARELLKELLRCVKLGLVSMPPVAIYQKLTEAAKSLGVSSGVLDAG